MVTQPASAYDPRTAIQRQLRVVALLLAALVVGLGGLASTVTIAGAVIAPGQIVVASDVKKIQHPTGGVVSEILVKDGSRVKEGQVLLTLDPTVSGANVAIVSGAVDALSAKQARLEAERDGREVRFPPELLARRNQPSAAQAMRDELRLYQLRASERQGQKAQLRERIDQLQQEIEGLAQESAAKQREIGLIEQELVGVRQLYGKSLVPLSRLNALERDAVQLRGEVAQLAASMAETRGKIAETRLAILQVDETARSDAGKELGDVQNQLAELEQKKVTAQQDFSRVQIRAPQSGVVDRLSVHTVGGVIAPGEPILYIVPDQDRLKVELRIRPQDVERVRVGERAVLRFSAFNFRTTPELNGRVSRVSAETETDQKTGAAYYVADVFVPDSEIARLHGLKLIPGMPVEAFVQTERRSMLSYVTKPLTDQLRRAFRED